jgi:hypothetical protein
MCKKPLSHCQGNASFLNRRKGNGGLGHRKHGTYVFAHLVSPKQCTTLFWEMCQLPFMKGADNKELIILRIPSIVVTFRADTFP